MEVDKSTKYKYKVKRAFVAGKRRHLQYDMRILTATVQDAVSNFKKSPEWKQFRHGNPDSDVHDKTVASCICPCTIPDTREECACPTCGEMHELLKALKNMRKTDQELHDECSCRHDCANPVSVYRKAASFSRPNSVKIKSRYFAGFCGLKHVPCMSNLLGIFVLGHYGALYTQNDENDVIFF